MPARLLDGKQIAQTIRSEIAQRVQQRLAQQLPPPGLTVVLVGDHPASRVYVRNKRKAAQEVGFVGQVLERSADIRQAELLDLIAQLNADPSVHGILVQLPLPRHIDEAAVIEAIDPAKDVDGFHPLTLGRLTAGHPTFLPCTPQGVQELLVRSGIPTAGVSTVIVGRSNIVGKPLALLLAQKPTPAFPLAGDATVTLVHSRTRNLAELTRSADLLIAAIGHPGFITGEMIRPGATVIDVGINSVAGQVVGDVDFASVYPRAGAITPVPGGIGPMTIAMLLKNTLQAAEALSR